MSDHDVWTELGASTSWLSRLDVRDVWAHRAVGIELARRDLKLRYKQTAIGVVWAILQPLAGAILFTVFFGRLNKLPSDGIPYALFVYSGLTIWWYVSESVLAAADSLVKDHKLVTTVYFPKLIAPIAAVMPGLVDLLISLVFVVAFMAYYGVAPGLGIVTLPFWILAAFAVAVSVGIWLSALNVLFRDVRYAYGFLVQIWLFSSPVVFAGSVVKGDWRYLFALNPMVGVLYGFRWSLLNTPAPHAEALVSLVTLIVLASTGSLYFRRMEKQFADRI